MSERKPCKNCKHQIEFNESRGIFLHCRDPYEFHSLGYSNEKYLKRILIPCFCGCKKPEVMSDKNKRTLGVKS